MKYLISTILIILFISCGNDETRIKEKELELRERELKLKEEELKQKATEAEKTTPSRNNSPAPIQETVQNKETQNNTVGLTKYLYVLIETLEPKVVTKPKSVQEQENELKNGVSFPVKKEVKFESFVHISDIVEVKNFKEDDKFRAIDKFEKTVRQKLSWTDYEVKNQIPPDEYFADIYKSNISDRKCFVFDTYAAASKSAVKH
ncbi:MAG: hypothetical protein J0L56_20120 [Chitinophagales bacterium]|nr:hypothetical protein [Chitinophagales bacterium]